MEETHSGQGRGYSSRRTFLAATAGAGAVGLAGCLSAFGSEGDDDVSPRGEPLQPDEAVSWDDLGDLDGELVVYSGRRRTQIMPLFEDLQDEYPDFDVTVEFDEDFNSIEQEGENTLAHVFYTQSSGDLARLKQEDLAFDLPDDIVDAVDANHSDEDGMWTGASGRVRAIQYNSDYWSAEELPNDIFEYAEDDRFQGVISTRPNSGTFFAFIVAMMELEGEEETRNWVRKMLDDQEIELYAGGSEQANAVHEGDQQIALGNQYYAGRIISEYPDSPLEVTFTQNDPGSLFNVSGLAIPKHSRNPGLAAEFIRHVLAREGQEFFVEVNGEYPVVDDVEYIGDLPTPDEINPPEFDLNELADIDRAGDLLRDEGMTV